MGEVENNQQLSAKSTIKHKPSSKNNPKHNQPRSSNLSKHPQQQFKKTLTLVNPERPANYFLIYEFTMVNCGRYK